MALQTKYILAPPKKGDGLRISVMSRHTLSDGKTPDSRITREKYHLHVKVLAPSGKLLGYYYRQGFSWKEYEEIYNKEMRAPLSILLQLLVGLYSRFFNVTLLCIEEDPENCHRRLLLKIIRHRLPFLRITVHTH